MAALFLLLVAAMPAAALVDTEAIARLVAKHSVYVQPGADVSAREAAALRERIERKAPGRIQLVVLDAADARQSGGVEETANAIDQAHPRRGTLIVATEDSVYAVTSYPQAARAASAIRRAVSASREERLAARLAAAVDAVAEIDPGPGSDLVAPPPPQAADSPADDFWDAVSTALLILAAALAVPLLGGAVWLIVRWRRRQAQDEEALTQEFAAAEERLIALGDDIRLLDLDVQMPRADPAGREAYERAVGLYEQASQAMNGKRTRRRLAAATTMLDDAQSLMHQAKRRLERPA